MDHATKALTGFEIKDADRGEVTAIVSTFNVVDRDGDVVLPGAIRDGSSVKLSSYSHKVITEGEAPVGKGIVRVDGERAVFEGRYFMSGRKGQEAFATVKELGEDSEWSIGYKKNVRTAPMTKAWAAKGAQRLIAELDLLEVSPVFIGANQFTATVGTKSQADGETEAVRWLKAAIARHERHMNGTEATSVASQQTMMDEMVAALHALEPTADAPPASHGSKSAEAAEAKRLEEEAAAKVQEEADAKRRAAELETIQRIHGRFVRTMRKVS